MEKNWKKCVCVELKWRRLCGGRGCDDWPAGCWLLLLMMKQKQQHISRPAAAEG
jgi:hypothetical protein